MRPLFGFLLAVLMALPVQAASLHTRLDRVIKQAVQSHQVVGGVLLVAKDGEILYHEPFGLADREAKLPTRLGTQFRLASMSKPIVTVTALALVDEGVLQLDAPVSQWIPEFTPRMEDGTQPVITLRQLMTHTAGLTNNYSEAKDPTFAWYGIDGGLANTGLAMVENTARIAHVPLKFEPGTAWWYSYATDVLGDVIERATGKPLAQVVAEKVSQPLGLSDVEFVAHDPDNLAIAYAEADAKQGEKLPTRMQDGQVVRRITFHPSRALSDKTYPSGGAGLLGTAHDYYLFLEALRTGGAPLLRAETDAELLRNQTGDLPIRLMGDGWGWALAFAYLKDPAAAKSPAHAGTIQWGGVYGSHFWMDKQAGITAVLLTNTAMTGTVGPFPEAIRAEVYR